MLQLQQQPAPVRRVVRHVQPQQRRLAHIDPVAPRIEARAQLLRARRPRAGSSSTSSTASARLPPHHLHRLRAALPTPPPCAGCRAGRSPPAAPPGTRPAAPGCRSRQSSTADTDRPRSPSGGGTGSLPAAAPAGRCPARSPRRPAPPPRSASISSCAQLHQRQHLRRDRLAARRDPVRRHLHLVALAAHRRRQLRQRRRREQRPHIRVQPRRRSRSISRTASSEWPPSSKKLSCRPTRSTPSTSAQISRQRRLRLAHRRLVAAPRVRVALRRRQRLAVQLAVRRQRQRLQPHIRRRHHVLRQPLAADARAAPRRRSAAPPRRRRSTPPAACPPARPRAPAPPPRAPPRAPRSRASISPSSIRKPRIFTWWSLPAQELDVPVRAASAPGPPSGTAARPARHRTDPARTAPPSAPAGPGSRAPRPRPPMYSSPATPTGTGSPGRVQHVHPRVRDRPPDGWHGPPAPPQRPGASRSVSSVGPYRFVDRARPPRARVQRGPPAPRRSGSPASVDRPHPGGEAAARQQRAPCAEGTRVDQAHLARIGRAPAAPARSPTRTMRPPHGRAGRKISQTDRSKQTEVDRQHAPTAPRACRRRPPSESSVDRAPVLDGHPLGLARRPEV